MLGELGCEFVRIRKSSGDPGPMAPFEDLQELNEWNSTNKITEAVIIEAKEWLLKNGYYHYHSDLHRQLMEEELKQLTRA